MLTIIRVRGAWPTLSPPCQAQMLRPQAMRVPMGQAFAQALSTLLLWVKQK